MHRYKKTFKQKGQTWLNEWRTSFQVLKSFMSALSQQQHNNKHGIQTETVKFCGQHHKCFTIVNYVSRVTPD